jgi:hypothetical protein
MIELAVIDRLKATPAVTALVGQRIYQLKLKQNTAFPAVRVQLADDVATYHLRGGTKLKVARVQIDAYGSQTVAAGVDPYDIVADLASAIEEALSGIRFVEDDVQVTGAFQVFRRVSDEAGTNPLIRQQQDFMFRYKRV